MYCLQAYFETQIHFPVPFFKHKHLTNKAIPKTTVARLLGRNLSSRIKFIVFKNLSPFVK